MTPKKITPYTILLFFTLIINLQASPLKEITNILTRPLDIAIHKNNQIAYISAPNCNCILIVDLSKENPDAMDNQIDIPNTALGKSHGLAMNILKNELYVIDSHSKLFTINTLTNSIDPTSLTVSEYPKNIVVSSNGKMIYVSSKNAIDIINAQTKTVETSIPLSQRIEPYGMALANQKLYVVGTATNKVYVVDLVSKTIIQTIDVQSFPYDAIATKDESFVYISHDGKESYLSVINSKTDKLYKTIPLGKENDHYKNSRGLAIIGSVLFVANYGDGSLSLIDTLTHKEIICDPIVQSGDNNPENMAVSNDDNFLYIVHPDNNSVRILDITQISPLPRLHLDKTGRGEIQVDDGVNISNVLPPMDKQYPKGSRIELTALPHDKYVFSKWAGDVSGYDNPIEIDLNEDMHIQAIFSDSTGYAIIVQGKRVDGEGMESHRKTTELAESIFKQRRLVTTYFKYDETDMEHTPSLSSIEHAITEWAYTNMNGKAGKLVILIVGHGDKEKIYFDSETLTADLFKEWLNTLQTKLKKNGQHNDIIIILGTCYSGSFISKLSGERRIIITSAHKDEMAFKGPVLDDSIRQGDFFIAEFLKKIQSNFSIKKSFVDAALLTRHFTYAISDSFVSMYDDRSLQHPMIDDNRDGEGSHDLRFSISGEGQVADTLYIGSLINKRQAQKFDLSFESEYILLDETQIYTSFQLNTSGYEQNDVFWIDIKTPVFSVQNQNNHSNHLEINTQRWQRSKADITPEGFIEWQNINAFVDPGEYQILFFAKSHHTNTISFLKEIRVYKQKFDNNPPNSFSIKRPKNEDIFPVYYPSESKYLFAFEWEKASDPDDDSLTYNLLISSSTNKNAGLSIKGLIKNQYIITFSDTPSENSLEMDKRYVWNVTAIDQYGASRQTDSCFFVAKNTSASSGILLFEIVDKNNRKRIKADTISVTGQVSISLKEDFYILHGFSGIYTVVFQANGYVRKEKTLTIPEGYQSTKIQTYFLNRLFHLSDIVKVLRVLTDFSMNDDINIVDDQLSLNDVIYIFHKNTEY